MMVAVVTGGTGFIGSHLVRALRAQGAEVRVLRRSSASRPSAAPADPTWHIDLHDAGAVARSGIWEGATHCFHVGGATRARTRAAFAHHNVLPTRHLAQAIAARGSAAPRFVFVSSQAAAGPASTPHEPVTEASVPQPIERYGASKLAAEREIEGMRAALPATIVRPAVVYGPGDRDLLEAFRQAVAPLGVFAAPADQRFSAVFVRDLVQALIAAATSQVAVGRTYFIADATPMSWRHLYARVAALAGVTPRTVQLPSWALRAAASVAPWWPTRDGTAPLATPDKVALARAPYWLCDASRARAELGWAPRVNEEAAIRETFDWYRDAGWLKAATRSAPALA